MKNTKIIHIAETIQGGIASYFEETIPYQIKKYGEENIRLLIPENQKHHLGNLPKSIIHTFKRKDRGLISFLRLTKESQQEIKNFSPDIIHLHSSFAGALIRFPYFFKIKRPKIVYCAHGWSFIMDTANWKKWVYATIENILALKTDKIINISYFERRMALKYGLPKKKNVVFCNGISKSSPKSGTIKLEEGKNKIKLLFVGRFHRTKGYDILLDAMRKLENAPLHLYLAGGCLPGEEVNLDLPSNVTLLGWLERPLLNACYKNIDAVVMPSRWDGFGLVAVEAMRTGKPVIASNVGEFPRMIEDKKEGYIFNLKKPKELENILKKLDRKTLSTLGENAKEKFLKNYTSDRLNQQIETLYENLTKK